MAYGDTISRQAAIDALTKDKKALEHIINEMSGYEKEFDRFVGQRNQVECDIYAIEQLPPAQPEPCEIEQYVETCEKCGFCDTISRQAVIDALNEVVKDHSITDFDAIASILDLPSAQPEQRTGHWIPVGMVEAVGGESAQWGSAVAYHKCSECDEQALRDDFEQEVLSKWCPHCGVKMVGVSE